MRTAVASVPVTVASVTEAAKSRAAAPVDELRVAARDMLADAAPLGRIAHQAGA